MQQSPNLVAVPKPGSRMSEDKMCETKLDDSITEEILRLDQTAEQQHECCCICANTITNKHNNYSVQALCDMHNMDDQKLCDCSADALTRICMSCYLKGGCRAVFHMPSTVFLNLPINLDLRHKCHLCSKERETTITREDWTLHNTLKPEKPVFWNFLQAYLFESNHASIKIAAITVVGGGEMRDPNNNMLRTVPDFTLEISLFTIDKLLVQVGTGLRVESGCCGRFCKVKTIMQTVSPTPRHTSSPMQIRVRTTTHKLGIKNKPRKSKRARQTTTEVGGIKKVCVDLSEVS